MLHCIGIAKKFTVLLNITFALKNVRSFILNETHKSNVRIMFNAEFLLPSQLF